MKRLKYHIMSNGAFYNNDRKIGYYPPRYFDERSDVECTREEIEIPDTRIPLSYYKNSERQATVLRKVMAYTYYCDTGPGLEDSTEGDGSVENPFKSVNYALEKIYPIVNGIMEKVCTWELFIQLKCTGTADYPISNANFDETVWINGLNLHYSRTDNTSREWYIINVANSGIINANIDIDVYLEINDNLTVGRITAIKNSLYCYNVNINGIYEYTGYYGKFFGGIIGTGNTWTWDCVVNLNVIGKKAYIFAGTPVAFAYGSFINCKGLCEGYAFNTRWADEDDSFTLTFLEFTNCLNCDASAVYFNESDEFYSYASAFAFGENCWNCTATATVTGGETQRASKYYNVTNTYNCT